MTLVLGNLYMSGDRLRIWCDAKVYANHMYIIREVNAGLQVFDLETPRAYYNTPSQHVRQLKEETVHAAPPTFQMREVQPWRPAACS